MLGMIHAWRSRPALEVRHQLVPLHRLMVTEFFEGFRAGGCDGLLSPFRLWNGQDEDEAVLADFLNKGSMGGESLGGIGQEDAVRATSVTNAIAKVDQGGEGRKEISVIRGEGGRGVKAKGSLG